jgi:long-subunit acyl-CoA synthetase (AMP-forming)
VALLIGPRPEFHVVDTALLCAGAVPYSLQEGDPVAAMAESVQRAGAALLVTEARLRATADAVREATGVEVVAVDTDRDEVAASGGPDVDELWRAVGPEDVATLIFTSGTTGEPKAVQLSHRAIVTSEHGTDALAPFGNRDGTVLSYLPLNHIAERFMSHYAGLVFGVTVRSVPDPDRLYDEIAATRPSRFFGVPRVYEKLLQRARALVDTGINVHEVPTTLGLDRAEFLGVATAPSSRGMLAGLRGVGLEVCDLWGMSEAIMCTLNPPGAVRLGTVGTFLPSVEGRIAADGEILVRGSNVFSGYLGDAERTAELVDADGWVHTGDVGSIEDGYLTIRGRKKELLITSAGKNIAPAAVEGALKDASPLVDHAVAVADGRRWVTALLVLDEIELARVVGDGDFATAACSTTVRALLDQAVTAANERLARAEQVRGYHVVRRPWRPGDPELTPTLKLRRDVIAQTYAQEIEELYR